jgi:hypothetical protein
VSTALCEDEATAGPGVAMTVEVGVITGALTVRTTGQADGLVHIAVQYTGAEERYTLQGSPAPRAASFRGSVRVDAGSDG